MRARGTKDITQNPTKSFCYFNIVMLFLKINELMNGKLALMVNVETVLSHIPIGRGEISFL